MTLETWLHILNMVLLLGVTGMLVAVLVQVMKMIKRFKDDEDTGKDEEESESAS